VPHWYETDFYYRLYHKCHLGVDENPLDSSSHGGVSTFRQSNQSGTPAAERFCRPQLLLVGSWVVCEWSSEPERTSVPPPRPTDLHWIMFSNRGAVRWRDNSTNEDGFDLYECGNPTPLLQTDPFGHTYATLDRYGTGFEYSTVIPDEILDHTVGRGCFYVKAYNVRGQSPNTPDLEFVTAVGGNCGSEIPCGHTHSGSVDLILFASRNWEGDPNVNFIAYNDGFGTAIGLDFWDNLFGVHRIGPWDIGPGQNTTWRTVPITSTRAITMTWKATWESLTHWEGLNYHP
jgi:hypothetical protein